MTTTTETVQKEPVISMTNYYDKPLSGIALFRGIPHSYEAVFNKEQDGYSPYYLLYPIPPHQLKLLLESWGIWERYITAYHAGTLSEEDKENFGSLRGENDRKSEVEKLLKETDFHASSKTKEFCIQVTATFDRRQFKPVVEHKPKEVAWKSIVNVGSLYFQKLLDCQSAKSPFQNQKEIEPHYTDCSIVFS